MADPNGWLSTLRLSYRNKPTWQRRLKKIPQTIFQRFFRTETLGGLVLLAIRSCRAGYCEFAVGRSLRPSLGDTADAGNR